MRISHGPRRSTNRMGEGNTSPFLFRDFLMTDFSVVHNDSIYILYSPRGLGWFTRSSTYSTELSEAKIFTRKDALAMVHKHRVDGAHNMIPVRMEDIS